MSFQELDIYLKSFEEDYKQHKEELRLLGWWILASHSTKKVKLEDVMKFDWDNEKTGSTEKMTKERFEGLKNKYLEVLNKRNNGKQ